MPRPPNSPDSWRDLQSMPHLAAPGDIFGQRLEPRRAQPAMELPTFDSQQVTLADMASVCCFFTPALITVCGRLERDLLQDFLERDPRGRSAQIGMVRLENRPYLQLPGSNPFLAETLFFVDKPHWPALRHFFTTLGILHRDAGTYYRVLCEEVGLLDLLYMERHPAAETWQVPRLTVGVFTLAGNTCHWTVRRVLPEPWAPLEAVKLPPRDLEITLGKNFLSEYAFPLEPLDGLEPVPETVAPVPQEDIRETAVFLRESWNRLYGDPSDPTTQERILRTVRELGGES